MSTPLKQHKETEAKLHDQLYNNILLLTYKYPTTKDFDAVFKKDMFFKNNKAAFHQVVYYLLNILNPELTKEKISTWPIYDVKYEYKFRNEIVSYINELNNIYEGADIPTITTSHLISPGGFKFIKFMWKLSQVVLFEHLKKNVTIEKELLGPISPHSNTTIANIQLKHLKKKTAIIEADTRQKYENFLLAFEDKSQEASNIVFEQSEVNKNLGDVAKDLERKKNIIKNNGGNVEEFLQTKLNEINENNKSMEEVKELCLKCDELLKYLTSDKTVLEYNKNELVLPKDAVYLNSNENDKIDLHHLLEDFIAVLQKENLEIPFFTTNELDNAEKILEELIEKCSTLDNKININKDKLLKMVEVFHQVTESGMDTENQDSFD